MIRDHFEITSQIMHLMKKNNLTKEEVHYSTLSLFVFQFPSESNFG